MPAAYRSEVPVPTVQNIVTDAAGSPIPNAVVRIDLIAGSVIAQPGYTATTTIGPPLLFNADSVGRWSVVLAGNATLTPANTYYRIIEAGFVSTVVVPAAGGPYNLSAVLVAPPTPASPGITGVQVALAGTVVGSRPQINLIQGAGATLAVADNPANSRVDVTVGSAGGAGGVPTTRLVNTTAPLTGGGDLSADRTLAVGDATAGAKGVVQLAGDLAGTAAAPVIATGAVTSAKIADGTIVDADISGAAAIAQGKIAGLGGAASLSVGTTAGTVAAGDDGRILGAQQRSVLTAKGDLYVATAAGTVTRLPVGSDGQVLTSDSAQAAGAKWAPGGAGGGVSLPLGLNPKSNRWTAIPSTGRVGANFAATVNLLYLIPLPVGSTARTLTGLSCQVQIAAGAGGLVRSMLLSSDAQGDPNLALFDYGTIATDTTGVKAWTAMTSALSANTLYWVGLNFTVAAPSLVSVDTFSPYVSIAGSMAGTAAFAAYLMSGVSGPLGATPFTYFDVDLAIRIGVRFS